MNTPGPSPAVSVVVSVYNGARYLRESLQSILCQEGVPFEVIVVDDGSSDATPQILDEMARRYPCLRIIRQENQGLTRSLVRACAEARGEFIARHDADDVSFPGRLARQVRLLRECPNLVFVGCRGWLIGPNDEVLVEVTRPVDAALATRRLVCEREGPFHGSVMFRAATYRQVGGYRPAFRYAQDWDLWLRFAQRGQIAYVPDCLYAFRVSDQALTTSRRHQQRRLVATAWECFQARQRGVSEAPLLDQAEAISQEPPAPGVRCLAANNYFIGKCLLDRRDRRAIAYLRTSVRHNPWGWRPWAALAAAYLLCRRSVALPKV
jgi:glycosyltransferase involved in cell wall biosynthesis